MERRGQRRKRAAAAATVDRREEERGILWGCGDGGDGYSEPASRVRSIKLSFTGAKVCWACSILICVYFIFEEITRTWFSYVTILSIPVDV